MFYEGMIAYLSSTQVRCKKVLINKTKLRIHPLRLARLKEIPKEVIFSMKIHSNCNIKT